VPCSAPKGLLLRQNISTIRQTVEHQRVGGEQGGVDFHAPFLADKKISSRTFIKKARQETDEPSFLSNS
jgi:hypothetical protein